MELPSKQLGDLFGQTFEEVERDTIDKIVSGDRKEEDHITSTWMTLAEERFRQADITGLSIETRQFQGRGNNSDESITGADGAVILNARLADTDFQKFYLFQSKKFNKKNSKFDEKAIDQKWRMLVFTSDSFFLTYSDKKFSFVSAFLVGLNNKLTELPSKTFSGFHQDFFNCFIGDHSFRMPFFPPSRWYFEFWDRAWDYLKFNDENPIAKHNLLIQIKQKES